MPEVMPNNWFTTLFFGAIQQGKLKVLKAGKMKSGNQYQQKETVPAIVKNAYRDIFHVLKLVLYEFDSLFVQ